MTFSTEIGISKVVRNPVFSLRLSTLNGINITTWRSNDFLISPLENDLKRDLDISIVVQDLFLLNGIYKVSIGFADGKEVLHLAEDCLQFEIIPAKPQNGLISITKEKSSNSLIYKKAEWHVL